MKNACIYFLLLPFLFTISVNAQTDTLKLSSESIFDTQATISEKITKLRYKLIDYIIADDSVKALETFHYLIQGLENEHYAALYWHEKLLFAYLFEQYRYILSEIYNLNEATVSVMREKITPREDQLYVVLYKKAGKNSQKIFSAIDNSAQLSAEERQFLRLVLHTYTIEYSPRSQKIINDEADAFLNEYPRSVYENYVLNYVRYRYVIEGYLGLTIGGGTSAIFGDAKNFLHDEGSFLMEVSYGKSGKYHVTLTVSPIFASVKKSFTGNEGYVFRQDSSADITCISMAFFYDRLHTRRLVLSPFIGAGWATLASEASDAKNNKEGVTAAALPMVGLEGSWYFLKHKEYLSFPEISAEFALSLRYTYFPLFYGKNYNFLNGSAHTITVNLIMRIGELKRAY